MSLVERIKKLATDKQMTIAELERKVDLGGGTISRWNLRTPGVDKIQKVADYFDVSTDYLLGRTDNKNPIQDSNDQQIDLKTFLEVDSQNAYYGGEKLTQEEKDTIRKILTGLFLETSKDLNGKKK